MKIVRNDEILIVYTNKTDGDFLIDGDNIGSYMDLADQIGIDFLDIYVARQNHGTLIFEMEFGKHVRQKCDAIYTKAKGLYLGINLADCLGILGYDKTNDIVFAIHSGWIGSSKLITTKTIKYLIKKENLDIENTVFYLSPSIKQNNYEVGNEVYYKIIKTNIKDSKDCFIKKDNNKYLFNNQLFNIRQLLLLGVKKENINISDDDTYGNIYHSYRYDKTNKRNLALIGIKKD